MDLDSAVVPMGLQPIEVTSSSTTRNRQSQNYAERDPTGRFSEGFLVSATQMKIAGM